MKDNSSEMSLDEVLSSIKKMVVDSEPPVLELTDMVSENGDIVKVKSGVSNSSSDMGSFLKLIQENDDSPKLTLESPNVVRSEQPEQRSPKAGSSEFLKEIATTLIQQWINENLPGLVKEVAETEIKKILSQN